MHSLLSKIFFWKKSPAYDKIMELSSDEIIAFKSQAWQGSKNVSHYLKAMEHTFFDAVTAKLFLKYLKPEFNVLDVGAGTGRLTMLVADMGCSVTALDISAEMLHVIDKQKGKRTIETVKASGDILPFAEETFDAIVQMDFLIHFPNWLAMLSEQLRVCKPSGMVIFNLLNADNMRSFDGPREAAVAYLSGGGYFASCTREELATFALANGAEVVGVHPYRLFFNSYAEATLSQKEFAELSRLLNKAFTNEKIFSAMVQLEHEIVAKLPSDATAMSVFALRKK